MCECVARTGTCVYVCVCKVRLTTDKATILTKKNVCMSAVAKAPKLRAEDSSDISVVIRYSPVSGSVVLTDTSGHDPSIVRLSHPSGFPVVHMCGQALIQFPVINETNWTRTLMRPFVTRLQCNYAAGSQLDCGEFGQIQGRRRVFTGVRSQWRVSTQTLTFSTWWRKYVLFQGLEVREL